MTNINCTKNCIFQKDGLCTYDDTSVTLSGSIPEDSRRICVYQRCEADEG